MKLTIVLLMIGMVFCFAKCEKDKVDFNGLPQATQEGKNKIGFLVNGQPWTPRGIRGTTSNISIDYAPRFKQGAFNIVAYDFKPENAEQFTIAIRDSLNFITAPATFSLSNNSLYGISYSNGECTFFSVHSDVESSGSLTITKLDRDNGIISGIFNATLSKNGCSIITITEGRFDMRF